MNSRIHDPSRLEHTTTPTPGLTLGDFVYVRMGYLGTGSVTAFKNTSASLQKTPSYAHVLAGRCLVDASAKWRD